MTRAQVRDLREKQKMGELLFIGFEVQMLVNAPHMVYHRDFGHPKEMDWKALNLLQEVYVCYRTPMTMYAAELIMALEEEYCAIIGWNLDKQSMNDWWLARNATHQTLMINPVKYPHWFDPERQWYQPAPKIDLVPSPWKPMSSEMLAFLQTNHIPESEIPF